MVENGTSLEAGAEASATMPDAATTSVGQLGVGPEDVHILLVDDRPANLDALEAILKRTRFTLTRAESGAAALKCLLQRDFACCLMDIRMPEMDGFETAQLIRADAELRNLPIIFVTAEAGEQREVFRGYEAGAVDFLIKPLDPAIVRSKVRVFGELYLQKIKLARSEEIEALNGKLAAANRELARVNQDLEHFTHIAAHDLREPVRKQRNLIDLLREEVSAAPGSELDRYLNLIGRSADQMLGMIEAFRALTKIEYTRLQRRPTELRALIEEVLARHEDSLAARGCSVSFSPELGEEEVYPPLVAMLYDNLIRNVLDHAHGNGFRIAFTVTTSNDVRTYGVENTGSAVATRDLTKIFKIFRKGGASAGSGVGLSICKRVVERHKGRIFAESGDDSVHIRFTFGEGRD